MASLPDGNFSFFTHFVITRAFIGKLDIVLIEIIPIHMSVVIAHKPEIM